METRSEDRVNFDAVRARVRDGAASMETRSEDRVNKPRWAWIDAWPVASMETRSEDRVNTPLPSLATPVLWLQWRRGPKTA